MTSRQTPFEAPVLGIILLLFLGILQVTLFGQSAVASPLTEINPRDDVNPYRGLIAGKIGDGGPETSDYPDDNAIRDNFITPTGSFVFFSGIPNSQPASNFAQSLKNHSVTYHDAFPPQFVKHTTPANSTQWFQDYLDRLFGIFAENAVGDVFLVTHFDEIVRACSIWHRIELATLEANPAVSSITLVDYTNFSNKKILIESSTKRSMAQNNNHDTLQKRDDTYCPDWAGSGNDPTGNSASGFAVNCFTVKILFTKHGVDCLAIHSFIFTGLLLPMVFA